MQYSVKLTFKKQESGNSATFFPVENYLVADNAEGIAGKLKDFFSGGHPVSVEAREGEGSKLTNIAILKDGKKAFEIHGILDKKGNPVASWGTYEARAVDKEILNALINEFPEQKDVLKFGAPVVSVSR